jgi:F420-non-reducing hydrogenase large subunit
MKEIVINPITRLEGHGKITIFLNDEGDVDEAYFQVPELRGFEKFCEGRRAEDLPIITTSNLRSLSSSPSHGKRQSP